MHVDLRYQILLVEDEADVRDVVAEILRRAGYRVRALESLAAVEIWLARQAPPIDLLLTDLVMPGGSGLDVARRVTSVYPGVAVLFMSGYSEATVSGHETVEHLIPKPFAAEALLDRVRTLLRGAQGRAVS